MIKLSKRLVILIIIIVFICFLTSLYSINWDLFKEDYSFGSIFREIKEAILAFLLMIWFIIYYLKIKKNR